ncbi:dihydroneopterin aldolase [Acidipropionibacterium virtanenii]|uniref:7,8-dihydroneopterin aldolase n=1 Tax=Acidipropionibacterium virtanenii TaxID=2057246 RepID=A0A344URF4_9ACTN|nr:dihydroneopterin aldolase [Acidipropionibacterium virtanenii]AXE37852.1 Dihydroneopterin aldolase [Acidipropionibacterium virtanenii]
MDIRDDPGHIRLTGITAIGHHGVLASEKAQGQPFIVDVDATVLLETGSDRLSDTVNYAELARAVIAEITGDPVDLIETLTGRIADRCLALDSRIRAVSITVHKPHAPVGVPLADVAVALTRSRQ